jgi:hypothetical protein
VPVANGRFGGVDGAKKVDEAKPEDRLGETLSVSNRAQYWTDADTSKLSINTAAEGVFWDTPEAQELRDKARALAYYRRLGPTEGVGGEQLLSFAD